MPNRREYWSNDELICYYKVWPDRSVVFCLHCDQTYEGADLIVPLALMVLHRQEAHGIARHLGPFDRLRAWATARWRLLGR